MSISCAAPLGADELTEGMFMVPGSEDETPGKQTVNRWNVCRVIGNDSSGGQLVPTRDEREWALGLDSYLNNTGTMPGITLQDCRDAYESEATVSPAGEVPESMQVYPLGSCSACHIGMEDPRLAGDVFDEDVLEAILEDFKYPQDKFIDVDGAAPCPTDETGYTWIVYCDMP